MIFLITAFITMAPAHSSAWSNFCEKHLVAEDPYQYENLSVEQLVTVYLRHMASKIKSKALAGEIIYRLRGELSYEERQLLKVTGYGHRP